MSSLEKENGELEAEGRRLRKKLDGLSSMAFQLEAAEQESLQLEQENLELRRSGARAAQLEVENRELESERSQMKRSLEMLKASSKKTERLEV